jgi:uncharacterized membrane protein
MNVAEQKFSHYVSVPSDEGIRVDEVITIERPVAEVYSFWRRLENLPRFMRHIKSIAVRDDLHSHWVVKGPLGKDVEWDAEIIEQRENEMISWRSIPGADVDNAGSVWFTPLPGGTGAIVRVSLKYVPPAGKAGALIAKLFGRDPRSEMREDLGRLKSFLETGQLPPEKDAQAWPRIAAESTRKAVQAADTCVHENPWSAIASVAVGCFALGFFLARARD